MWYSILSGCHDVANRCIRLLTVAFLVTAICPLLSRGQEIDPSNPFFLKAGVDRANLIVVGTFRVDWFYPWFDGWHYSGALHINEVLDGGRTSGPPIEFRWKEIYGATCITCNRMSRINGERGIWLLTEKEGRWLFSGTAATLCGWSLPMHVRGVVEQAIRAKRTRGVAQ